MIAIGSDHLGYDLKKVLKRFVEEDLCIECVDVGVHSHRAVDYPDVAIKVADKIRDGSCSQGILICGTGIGMAIAANKVLGVYAAVCHDPYSAERARKSNDANVMCIGALVVGPELAKSLAGTWLSSDFQGGNSARKIGKIAAIERRESRTKAVTLPPTKAAKV
ncbi:MAG: ribose 5-phosphate isomerase B [Armatimonadetes bacterium]|nr:ribose 5-phosphate isomerase B [Armatimonadota bacterium]